MNVINEIVVNTLRTKNNLSTALVLERKCKIERLYVKCEI